MSEQDVQAAMDAARQKAQDYQDQRPGEAPPEVDAHPLVPDGHNGRLPS